MKVLFTLFIIFHLLFAGTALSLNSPAYQEITHSKFGRTVLETIQVQVKSHTGADPRPQILALLKEISEGISQALQDADLNIRNGREKCKNDQDELGRIINQLDGQIKDDTKKKTGLEDAIAALKSEQSSQESLLEGYNKELKSKTDARQASQDLFDVKDKKLAQILIVLDTTKKYISDRLQARTGTSFLETGTNALLQVRETVESPSFQMVSAGYGQLISFIATKALTKFKQAPDEKAISGLQDIVDLIDNLLRQTQQDKAGAELENNQEIQDYNDAKSSLDNSITLTNTAISSFKGQIATAERDLNNVNNDLQTNNELLTNKKKDLDDNKASCQKADEDYVEFVQARNSETEVIDEITRIVNEDLFTPEGSGAEA